ncbi:hypothetical protein QM996_31710 (plasmid) [Sinorhizobium chiapasense]|uniref:hypothetical protein n=1 Tax=Sinorhizobium chiapasense TaxID=501572 RepID=UPI002FE2F9FB
MSVPGGGRVSGQSQFARGLTGKKGSPQEVQHSAGDSREPGPTTPGKPLSERGMRTIAKSLRKSLTCPVPASTARSLADVV